MHIPENLLRKNFYWLFAFPLLICLNSCVTFRTVHPEYLESDTTKDIVVYTFDGRIIEMMGGDYQIVRVDDTLYLRGQGQLFANDRFSEPKSFKDKLLLKDIKNIETREKKFFYYTGPILFGAATFFAILVVIVYGGRGAGG